MERFAVDVKGMRELQGSRELWRLVKELPVNVFDEFNRDDVERRPTYCSVIVRPVEGQRAVEVVVDDDGEGFQNLEDAYTLFRPTPKRGQPQVAGRFNLGEKEIMALAREGIIETTAGTVTFPRNGGRKVNRWRKRERGTKVWLVLPATKEQASSCVSMLGELIPPEGLLLQVNGQTIQRPPEVARTRSTLPTIVQKKPGNPLEHTYRTTDVIIRQPSNGQAWLYELGCPIQPMECAFSADVQQKVPMPPERDTVSSYYLQDIYAAVANATAELLTEENAADSWIKQALEDSDTKPETAEKIIRLRHGDRAVLWSSNPEANERATEAGYVVVPRTALSAKERERYVDAGVRRASEVFGVKFVAADVVEPDDNMRKVARFAQAVAEAILGMEISVAFYRLPGSHTVAQYSPVLDALCFNVANLPPEWFERLTPEVVGVILHELGHHTDGGREFPHGHDYVRRLETLAGRLFITTFKWQDEAEAVRSAALQLPIGDFRPEV